MNIIMFFDYNKNNTLYVNKTPQVMENLHGNIAVFYNSTLNPSVPAVVAGERYTLIDIVNIKLFRYRSIKHCDSMFVINIDHVDYEMLFDLFVSIPIQLNANTAGGKSIDNIKHFFSNIIY
jgi:hypothetical protein